ncbi:MAG: ATP-binding protein [Verrucomicrobia bacterium]|nr:ATP-binding protein [Verrucomicrobiota bacterium]
MALNRRNRVKSGFLDKALGHLGRFDPSGLQSVVQRLAKEREFLESLFNTIDSGIIVTDDQGRMVYFNLMATRMLGIPTETAEEELVTRYLPDLDWAHISALDRAGGNGMFRTEFEVEYPRHRLIRLNVRPLDGAAPGSSGLVLVLNDATEARQATSEAVEAERVHALTLLAGSLAHEIGNPLNALHIHLQLMAREVRKLQRVDGVPDLKEAVDRLNGFLGVATGEIDRLDYIITEFLQALRPSVPKLQAGSLNDTGQETLALLRPELEDRGLKVVSELASSLPPVLFDPAQLKQVLVNLIKNAMQAMPPQGTLTVRSGSTQEAVWMAVSDTGPGIPPEQLNRIFEPFYTTKNKGTGLGLLIVQRIIRDHGGRIELESTVGKGTTFKLWLPLRDRRPRMIASSTSEA